MWKFLRVKSRIFVFNFLISWSFSCIWTKQSSTFRCSFMFSSNAFSTIAMSSRFPLSCAHSRCADISCDVEGGSPTTIQGLLSRWPLPLPLLLFRGLIASLLNTCMVLSQNLLYKSDVLNLLERGMFVFANSQISSYRRTLWSTLILDDLRVTLCPLKSPTVPLWRKSPFANTICPRNMFRVDYVLQPM